MASLSRILGIPNLKQRLAAPIDELWDRRLGVHTFGFHPAIGRYGDPEWGSHFVPLGWGEIFAILDAAELGRDDVFTDLGCGTGRAVLAAAWRGARRAEGVEIVPTLAKAAAANLAQGRLRARAMTIVEGDARAVSLAETTVLYMFHALGTGVIRDVLERARTDRAASEAGRLRICYANPVYAEILDRTDWLRPLRSLAPRRGLLGRRRYATRIWESV